MSERMANAPVYYALAQVRFNTLPAIHKYVDDIQDQLRRRGYTIFDPLDAIELQLKGDQPEVRRSKSWMMSTKDRRSGYVLSESSLVFHDTGYTTHEPFIDAMLDGLRVVHDVCTLDHVNRVGLRYLNAVLPGENEHVEDYLDDGLCGVDIGAPRIHALYESVFQTECRPLVKQGTLVLRVHRREGELGFPPDLQQHRLTLSERFSIARKCDHAVLDIDHFSSGTLALDFGALQEQFLSLHDGVRNTFNTVGSEHARRIWKEEA